MTLNNIIQFEDVSVYHKTKQVLNHINFSFNKNDFLVIHGAMTSGKTTIFNVMSGREENYEGIYKLFEINYKDYSKKSIKIQKEKIGFMPSSLYFDENLNVNQNLLLINDNPRITLLEALALVDGKELYSKNMQSLNGLDRIKVYLAGLLLSCPSYLVLDEPTGHLEAERRTEIYKILDNLYEMGISILVLTGKNDNLKKNYKIKYIKNGRPI